MAFIEFWEQDAPVIPALRKWVEQVLHKSVLDVLRVEFNPTIISLADENVYIYMQMPDKSYNLHWQASTRTIKIVEG